jgi:hypothetical protein
LTLRIMSFAITNEISQKNQISSLLDILFFVEKKNKMSLKSDFLWPLVIMPIMALQLYYLILWDFSPKTAVDSNAIANIFFALENLS